MDKAIAGSIGSRQAVKAISIGLIIAYSVMGLLDYPYTGFKQAILWFWYANTRFKLTLCFAVATIFATGYFLGRAAGTDILIKNKKWAWTGIKYGFLIVWSTTIVTSLAGVAENMSSDSEVLYNYMFKPVYWVTLFGFIPIIIVSLWFGKSIAKKIN